MTLDNTEIVRFTFRIEKPLYDEIIKKAQKHRRSINNQMIIMLEQNLKENAK